MKHEFRFPILSHEVVDGDTGRMVLDVGFKFYHRTSARLSGFDAPERYTPAGKLVTRVVQEWMKRREGAMEFHCIKIAGKYGRPIGTIYKVGNPADSIGAFLINAGLAKVYESGKRSWGDTELRLIEMKATDLLRGDG